MTAHLAHQHLLTLNAERVAAGLAGLDGNDAYRRDLEAEIEAARHAYIGAAVTEIASFRAQLNAPQVG